MKFEMITTKYTLTGEYCDTCSVPLAEELNGDSSKCKMCE